MPMKTCGVRHLFYHLLQQLWQYHCPLQRGQSDRPRAGSCRAPHCPRAGTELPSQSTEAVGERQGFTFPTGSVLCCVANLPCPILSCAGFDLLMVLTCGLKKSGAAVKSTDSGVIDLWPPGRRNTSARQWLVLRLVRECFSSPGVSEMQKRGHWT